MCQGPAKWTVPMVGVTPGPCPAPEGQPVPERGRHVPFAKGIRVPRETLGVCPRPCWASSPGRDRSSTHPQGQHATDIHGVTLLALQPVHAGTSLWMSSTDESRPHPPANQGVTSDALASRPTPRHRLRHPDVIPPLGDTIGFGVQWVQDVQTGWGDAVEEAMAEATNRPGAGLTGLPGKPISPFIPARPWGPWRGEKMRMRVFRAGATPVPSHGIRGGWRW